jgi:hypothetical protein
MDVNYKYVHNEEQKGIVRAEKLRQNENVLTQSASKQVEEMHQRGI